jgi:hypothetical protein
VTITPMTHAWTGHKVGTSHAARSEESFQRRKKGRDRRWSAIPPEDRRTRSYGFAGRVPSVTETVTCRPSRSTSM